MDERLRFIARLLEGEKEAGRGGGDAALRSEERKKF
jgi:hypothetical protein